MADQTFTSGQILTAAQMTTLQANSGLVVVTPTGVTGGTISGSTITIGAAVSSVAVAGAFTSSFDNYKITINGGAGSVTAGVGLILTGSTTGYYEAITRVAFSTSTLTGTGINNGAAFDIGRSQTDTIAISFELMQPFLAKPTTITGSSSDTRILGGVAGSQYTGFHSVASSFTGFTISWDSGTFTGGTIRIYGYRNS